MIPMNARETCIAIEFVHVGLFICVAIGISTGVFVASTATFVTVMTIAKHTPTHGSIGNTTILKVTTTMKEFAKGNAVLAKMMFQPLTFLTFKTTEFGPPKQFVLFQEPVKLTLDRNAH